MADNVVPMGDIKVSTTDPIPETQGGKIYDELNGRLQEAFMVLLKLVQPKAGEKLDPNIQLLLSEVNARLRSAMYRVTDIATLVDRGTKSGERIGG